MIDYMAETSGGGGLAPPSPPQWRVLPAITLPQPSSLDTELGPGPMTLVSNFFSYHHPDDDLLSLSQLLVEAPPSPAAQNPPASLYHDSSSNCQEISEEYDQNQQDSDPQYGNSKFEYVISIPKPTSDGYNWRKYGQKLVKASKIPRCYYKCTQNNCPATKRIGHFIDGGISEIIYKGEHNHDPPPSRKRARNGAAMDQHSSSEEPTNKRQQVNHVVANEVEGDAANLKKRKTKFVHLDWASSSRIMVTEPKVVVQTRSDIDVLDDGFKWRKYGQKVVKGNMYPRSYYRCSYVGCKVRKHVERVSSDPKSVVTTYEGKHVHDTPVLAKHSSHNATDFKTERPPTLLQLKKEQISTF